MKLTKFYIIFLLLTISCSKDDNPLPNSYSGSIQSVKTYGGSLNEAGHSVISTIDGGYAVIGHAQSTDYDITDKTDNSYDYWLLKFNSNHELTWSKTYGGSDDDRGKDLIQTTDGGFLISGFSRSADGDVTENFGSYDFWLLKTDSSGNLLWQKTYGFSGTDQAFSVIQTSDSGYLLSGTLDVSASGGEGNSRSANRHAGGDYWVLKLNSNGEKQWSHYYGGTFTDTLYDVVETQNNNFLLVGSSDSDHVDISNNRGSYDFWVVKINNQGELLWEKNYGGSEIDEAFAITKTPQNNFIITGNTRSNDQQVSNNNGSSDIWAIEINADGDLIWQKTYGGTSFDISKGVIPARGGGFFIVGNSRSNDKNLTNNNGNNDIWVLKTATNGKLEWQKSIGGSEIDTANGIVQLNNQEVIVVGESWSSNFDIETNKGYSDLVVINIK